MDVQLKVNCKSILVARSRLGYTVEQIDPSLAYAWNSTVQPDLPSNLMCLKWLRYLTHQIKKMRQFSKPISKLLCPICDLLHNDDAKKLHSFVWRFAQKYLYLSVFIIMFLQRQIKFPIFNKHVNITCRRQIYTCQHCIM